MAIPLVLLVAPAPSVYMVIAAVFVVASLTDYLDGYLARRLDQQTRLGAVLDTIADKILVCIVLIVVVGGLEARSWITLPACLIIAREFLVSALRELEGAGVSGLAVTKIAKWKAAVQMCALFLLLLGCTTGGGMENGLVVAGVLAIWLAATMTVISGLDYFQRARATLFRGKTND